VVDGQVAVVTGAGSGIGEATAVAVARAGAAVVLAGRRIDPLNEVGERIIMQGGRAVAVACDVSRPEDVETPLRARRAPRSACGARVRGRRF
jgi:NADP-dependent 3-hydroxy acid dehydrogenase YdfG